MFIEQLHCLNTVTIKLMASKKNKLQKLKFREKPKFDQMKYLKLNCVAKPNKTASKIFSFCHTKSKNKKTNCNF